MTKNTAIRHNGKFIWIGNFKYEDGMASGTIHGKNVKAKARLDRGKYKYGTAKHALINELYKLYGTESFYQRKSRKGEKRPAIIDGYTVETTRTKRMANGVAKVTGFVNGVFIETYFRGESVNNGAKFDGKPYLRTEREALVREYIEKQNPKETKPKTAPIDDFFLHELNKNGVEIDKENNTAKYCDVEFSLDGMEQIDVVRKLGKIYNEYVEKCEREVKEFFDNFPNKSEVI